VRQTLTSAAGRPWLQQQLLAEVAGGGECADVFELRSHRLAAFAVGLI